MDLVGSQFITRSCFAYNGVRSKWVCVGGTKYNYRRKVQWPEPIMEQ
jgi:hypothetical protein